MPALSDAVGAPRVQYRPETGLIMAGATPELSTTFARHSRSRRADRHQLQRVRLVPGEVVDLLVHQGDLVFL